MRRIPGQRQQAAAVKLTPYESKQRRNLQFDWRKLTGAINQMIMSGPAASLPPAGQANRIYVATDTFYLYFDSGNGQWIQFGPGSEV